MSLKRVIVIGSTGSGKSALARTLGKILRIPVYHLDMLYWRSGWTRPPVVEWEEIQRDLIDREKWVIDGMYTQSLDMRLIACDTIIFLDFPRWITTYRIIRRWLQYSGKNRPDVTAGCREKLKWDLIKLAWNFPKNKRPTLLDKIGMFPEKKLITLTSSSEVQTVLMELSQSEHR